MIFRLSPFLPSTQDVPLISSTWPDRDKAGKTHSRDWRSCSTRPAIYVTFVGYASEMPKVNRREGIELFV